MTTFSKNLNPFLIACKRNVHQSKKNKRKQRKLKDNTFLYNDVRLESSKGK